ncbi:hypothetical protein [Pseudoponticoccus marisrubri]|uniref:hypothetical protein n=1 Tax=Pseudoponticoccus marisrubri TaxID=1685382 RepID=UPI0012FE23BF|nr:hypothetical protein [Pseudoponticoccus marisrubri]
MEKLYVTHDDAAVGAGMHPADFRAIRRVLNCPVPERRVSGSKKLHFDVEMIVEWLAHVMPRLSPEQEQRILQAARPAAHVDF